jgi:N,N-dimethylformamidase
MPDKRSLADGTRLLADLNALRAIGAYKTGVRKPTFSEPHQQSEDKAKHGSILGVRGLMGGGAAGHELARADTSLGTPPHAIIVGRAVREDPTYRSPPREQPTSETSSWPAR